MVGRGRGHVVNLGSTGHQTYPGRLLRNQPPSELFRRVETRSGKHRCVLILDPGLGGNRIVGQRRRYRACQNEVYQGFNALPSLMLVM